MAKRPTINTLANTASPTYLTQLNQNFTNVQTQFDNTLSLDGSTPNAMNADIDLNGNDLINAGSVNTATLRIGGQAVVASDAVNQTVKKEFETVALLLADTGTYTNYAADDYFRVVNGGFTYQVAASGASDQHVTTAGGVKLYVLRGTDGLWNVKAFGAVGDGVADDTLEIQAAITAACASGAGAVGASVFLPSGRYRITSGLVTTGSGGVGQCAIRGAGRFSTFIAPDGAFTAVTIRTTNVASGDFSIEWPETVAASIPATRIGVEFAGPDNQFSNNEAYNIQVRYAYRGFVLNDHTAGALGTIFLAKFRQLAAIRCADYGFYFDSKTGSTTTIFEQCYVRADNSLGQAYGKGFFLDSIEDIKFLQVAVDLCLNVGVLAQNYLSFTSDNLALEASSLTISGANLVTLNGSRNDLNAVKVTAGTFNTGAKANILRFGANAFRNTVRGYSEGTNTVVAGTTLYGVSFNADRTFVYIPDESVAFSGIDNNGWFANLIYGDKRVTATNLAPNYGTWERGDIVFNRSPSASGKIGHVCVTAGSPGTWKAWGPIDP